MRKLILLPTVLLSLASWPLRAEPSPAVVAHASGHGHTELDEKMETMNKAFRKLRRQIADAASNASSLELVADLRKAAEESVSLIPSRAEKVPEAEREKFTAAYAEKMKEFVAEVDKLKAALEAGKNDEAATLLAKLGSLQKSGHREFRAQKKE